MGWVEDTLEVEVPGGRATDGGPFMVRIRRLPASEAYLSWEDPKGAGVRETWRRWAELAIVAPRFYFGNPEKLEAPPPLIPWDSLPLMVHECLARKIAAYSFELSREAQTIADAFRGGHPTGVEVGGVGGGPGGNGDMAPGLEAEPAPIAVSDTAQGGAGV